MAVRIKLEGLKIARARGKWYVYRRSTGERLIRGLAGDRGVLMRALASPEFMQAYNAKRVPKRAAADLAGDTLGGLLHWFTNGDVDHCRDDRGKFVVPEGDPTAPGFPKWRKLARATRKDYLEAFDYLRDAFAIQLSDISQPDLYELRDKCAADKWPRFADQMIAALSSAFKQGVKRGNRTGLKSNPCLGMDKAHDADPNANREWLPEEWQLAFARAPMEIRICMMLAKHAGLRGQSIVVVSWKHYGDDPTSPTGKSIRLTTEKNRERAFLPSTFELQSFLADLRRTASSPLIAVRDNGQPWPSEKEMQTRVSHYFRDLERAGLIGSGTTLHGLRSSYAAWWKREGATDREIADLLGDKSVQMGAHYSRHVSREDNVIRAFERIKTKT